MLAVFFFFFFLFWCHIYTNVLPIKSFFWYIYLLYKCYYLSFFLSSHIFNNKSLYIVNGYGYGYGYDYIYCGALGNNINVFFISFVIYKYFYTCGCYKLCFIQTQHIIYFFIIIFFYYYIFLLLYFFISFLYKHILLYFFYYIMLVLT